ncbi:MAG: hypothetical protein UU53_C0028G0007 [Candidatus Curtissbacteria bacterium GW2011_GWC2_41_21]|nr:MAG: hypothetical protein UU53_C0028G0007 [Candidatus Curtissbacteria bacterium GW2011_GWC2_41_21]
MVPHSEINGKIRLISTLCHSGLSRIFTDLILESSSQTRFPRMTFVKLRLNVRSNV